MQKAILLLFYCLLFTVHSSYAQKIRFTDTSNKWRIIYTTVLNIHTTFHFDYSYSGDTVVNSQQYLKTDYGLIREDTINGLVYIKNLNSQLPMPYGIKDTTERVLYDYNKKVGDTFSIMITTSLGTGLNKHVIYSIDSTFINGVWHKIWEARGGISSSSDYYIIEGIGTLQGPWFPALPIEGEDHYSLICFNNNGSIVTVAKPSGGNYISTITCALSVENLNAKSQSITIIPNPANENSRIVFPYAIQQGRLWVTNTIGQVVLQKDFQSKEQLTLGALPAEGLYYYRVADIQNSATFTGKLVYE